MANNVAKDDVLSPSEIFARLNDAGINGFPPNEILRMHKAFRRFETGHTHDVHKDELTDLLTYLGYTKVQKGVVAEIAEEVTPYSTLDFNDFKAFAEKYLKQERAQVRAIFDQFDEDQSGLLSTSELVNFLVSIGFTPLRRTVQEALNAVNVEGSKTLTFEDLVKLAAIYRSTEGFTTEDVDRLRDAFAKELPSNEVARPDGDAEGRQEELLTPSGSKVGAELPTDRLAGVLLRFFGPVSAAAANKLGAEAMAGRRRPDMDQDEAVMRKTMSFSEVLLWARRMREEEIRNYHEEYQKHDKDGTGTIGHDEIQIVTRELGYTLMVETIGEAISEANEQTIAGEAVGTKDGRLGFEEFVNLMTILRERDGFSSKEFVVLEETFKRFDVNHSEEIDALELSDLLRYEGYTVNFVEVQQLLTKVDFNTNGRLDFREFLRLMRLHRESVLEQVRYRFERMCEQDGTIPGTLLNTFVVDLGYDVEVLRKDLTEDIAISTGTKFTFEEIVEVADAYREAKVRAQRRNAGFSEIELARFRSLFAEYERNNTGRIEPAEIGRLVCNLGFPMGTVEERDAVIEELDRARDAAVLVGIQDVGEKGTGFVNFWVLVQLLRVLYRRDDKMVLDRESRAMEHTNFSQAEADQFRDVFLTWFEKDRVFADEAAANIPNAKIVLRSADEDQNKELSKDCMRRLLRSLGVTMSAEDRKRLETKIDDFDTNGKVDFPDFLRLMRWILDTDFAGIQGSAAKAAKR